MQVPEPVCSRLVIPLDPSFKCCQKLSKNGGLVWVLDPTFDMLISVFAFGTAHFMPRETSPSVVGERTQADIGPTVAY